MADPIQLAISDLDDLNGAITAVATSITLTDASSFPATGKFKIKVFKADNSQSPEGILIASRSGNVLTVATGGRGYDGTTAAAWADGDLVICTATPEDWAHEWDDTDDFYRPKTGYGVAAKMYQSSGDQSLTGGTTTELTFNTSAYAYPANALSLADNAFVALVDGAYSVTCFAPYGTNVPGEMRMSVAIDDVTYDGWMMRPDDYDTAPTFRGTPPGYMELPLTEGDKVTIDLYVENNCVIRGTQAQGRWASFALLAAS